MISPIGTNGPNQENHSEQCLEAFMSSKEIIWYVYIVMCSDCSLYTGISIDVQKRIEMHNSGRGAKYTRTRLPVHKVYSEKVGSKSAALKREYAIKQLTRTGKMYLSTQQQIDPKTLPPWKGLDKLTKDLFHA